MSTYCCTETNCSTVDTSGQILITVDGITTQPSGTTTCSGNTGTFTVAANGSPTYQWYNSSGSISGATSASYTTGVAGSYYCVVTWAGVGSITSNNVTLTVGAPPITTQPQSVGIRSGTATFTVAAGGTPAPSYLWYNSSGAISGATSSTYTTGTAGSYYCVVTNSCGSTTSNTATLKVDPNIVSWWNFDTWMLQTYGWCSTLETPDLVGSNNGGAFYSTNPPTQVSPGRNGTGSAMQITSPNGQGFYSFATTGFSTNNGVFTWSYKMGSTSPADWTNLITTPLVMPGQTVPLGIQEWAGPGRNLAFTGPWEWGYSTVDVTPILYDGNWHTCQLAYSDGQPVTFSVDGNLIMQSSSAYVASNTALMDTVILGNRIDMWGSQAGIYDDFTYDSVPPPALPPYSDFFIDKITTPDGVNWNAQFLQVDVDTTSEPVLTSAYKGLACVDNGILYAVRDDGTLDRMYIYTNGYYNTQMLWVDPPCVLRLFC